MLRIAQQIPSKCRIGEWLQLTCEIRRYSNPLMTGHGPTRSTWTWLNLAAGVVNIPKGARIYLSTFDFWQDTQERAQAVISRLIFGQKYLAEISFTVAATPGCRVTKTTRRWVPGANCTTSFCFASLKVFSSLVSSEISTFFFFLLLNKLERGDRRSSQCGIKRL